ncbi:MAG: tRNA (guanine(10)-N(2))-dimethyltransferase [Nanoarchaeota archaeon]|nr:tRNA (guanine(10)-N(2))-dimethyltransferase [Nanoarchaeota archaeon]
MQTITEGKAKIQIDKKLEWADVSKDMPIFYNPQMKLNRDISVILLNATDKKDMQICDLLAGSGIRSIRFLKELKKGKIETIIINDYEKESSSSIEKNIELNKIKNKKITFKTKRAEEERQFIEVTNKDANMLMLESSGFDYIDIDPFGTPNPFLENAIKRISRNGILAVTATDTSALCGTFENACLRKYWAKPLHNEQMHEIGLRILIRKVQLMGAHQKKALLPIFCHSSDHYMRVYFACEKGRTKVDEILKMHKHFHDKINDINDVGPIWTGKLWDEKLVNAMIKEAKKTQEYSEAYKLIKKISGEMKIDVVGFYDMHKVCKLLKIYVPKKEILIKKIKNYGYKVAETHFNENGLKSDISYEELKKILE